MRRDVFFPKDIEVHTASAQSILDGMTFAALLQMAIVGVNITDPRNTLVLQSVHMGFHMCAQATNEAVGAMAPQVTPIKSMAAEVMATVSRWKEVESGD